MSNADEHYEKKYRIGGKQEKVDVFNLARHMINQAVPFIPGYPPDRSFSRNGLNSIVNALIEEINQLEQAPAQKSVLPQKSLITQMILEPNDVD